MALPTDPKDRRDSISLIVIGLLIISGGIAAMVVLNLCVEAAEESLGSKHSFTSGWYGFGLFIPGILSICAGATNRRGCHVANIVLSIIALGSYGIYTGKLLMATSDVPDSACQYNELCHRMLSLAKGGAAALCITWIFTLAALVVSSTKICCMAQQPGVVVLHQGPTTTVLTHHHSSMTSAGQPYIAPYHPSQAMPAAHATGGDPRAAAYAMDSYPPPPYMTSSDKAELTKSAY